MAVVADRFAELAVHSARSTSAPHTRSTAPGTLRVVLVHAAVPGRMRLNISVLYRAPGVALNLVAAMRRQPVVRDAKASPLTGNLLILHDTSLDAQAVIDLVHQALARLSSDAPTVSEVVPATLAAATPWHSLSIRTCTEQCDVQPEQGLSHAAAAARLARLGRNALPQPQPRVALALFLEQFKTLPVALLGVSAAVSVATGGIADAVVILAVVLINATIGYITESQAERIIGALNVMPRRLVRVLRDDQVCEVDAETVVVGDVLLLAPGEPVAADGRLIEIRELSVDEAALTGESMPVNKTVVPLGRRDVPLADRTNMVHMGTTVTGGSGRAVVVATGLGTEIGRVHALLSVTSAPQTPMQRQLDDMGRQLVLASGAICGVIFGVGMLRGYGLLQMLKTSISLAVAAVPEGLPAVATTTLSLGIRNMRRHGVLIRHLAAVETLGSVQVICMDKTGTLTINRMSAVTLQTSSTTFTVSSRGLHCEEQHFLEPLRHPDLVPLLQVAVLCNDTQILQAAHQYSLSGSATENALLAVALAVGMDVSAVRARHPRLRTHYRSETRRYMVTEHIAPDSQTWVAVKGSPAEVLDMCDWYLQDGQRRRLNNMQRIAITTENERAAGATLRVLGFAYGTTLPEHDAPPQDLIWLGMVGMMDPIRDGVKELIPSFHAAGIDTVMITGDQSATAYAIGKALNLSAGGALEILDSSRLDLVDDGVLRALVQNVHIFARVSPAHKLKIVQALQRAGKVVAMTGDGINDSPALKAADIGVTLGDSGTEAARSVADVVLEKDDLQTMLLTVSHGRTIYSNIRKAIHYLLATNMSEIIVLGTGIATGMGQPLSAIQLLWINLISDIFPGLALAVEPPEPDVLQRPPRDPQASIVAWSDFKRLGLEAAVLSAGALTSYGYGRLRYGAGAQAGTLAFMSLSTAQILHALSCRSEHHRIFGADRLPPNRYLTLAVGSSLAVQGLAAAVPGLRNFLGLAPLGPVDLLVVAGGAAGPLLINEFTKGTRTTRPAPGGT